MYKLFKILVQKWISFLPGFLWCTFIMQNSNKQLFEGIKW